MRLEGAVRDRLIMVGAAAPSILGFGLGFLFTRDLVQAAAIGGVSALVSAGLSLTPPVTAARMRNLRRKYPKED
ncbi:hypothetical protein [Brevundimonas sp.]|uniref:hypothetical protein n=1 Tax=Brevundimonas sp. TaxID=1871086 RepID=UPI00289854E3|nr:hypothetical protein [Brevundimonas sp.]